MMIIMIIMLISSLISEAGCPRPLARSGVGGGLLAARAPAALRAASRAPSRAPPQSRAAGVVSLAAAEVLAAEDQGEPLV